MRQIGMCACGNKGYKKMQRHSVCQRCHKLERERKFGELYNQTSINKMADKIRAEIAEYKGKTIMYLE